MSVEITGVPLVESGSANLTALNAALTLNTEGKSVAIFAVSGVWVATLTFEATLNGTTWFAVQAETLGAAPSVGAAISANTTVSVKCGGFVGVRLRVSAYTSGTAAVLGTAVDGSNDSFFMQLSDGVDGPVSVKDSNLPALAADRALVVAHSPNTLLITRYKELNTFTVVAPAVALGNNKSMASLLNAAGSGVVIKVLEVYLVNVATTTVTGVAATFEMRRCTGHTVGTLLTVGDRMDSTDAALNANVTARTGATIAGESAALGWRALWSSDEWGPGATDVEAADHAQQMGIPLFAKRVPDQKPITLRPGEGLTIKCATNSTAGSFDVLFVFTQE